MSKALYFLIGAAIGSVATYFFLKRDKHEESEVSNSEESYEEESETLQDIYEKAKEDILRHEPDSEERKKAERNLEYLSHVAKYAAAATATEAVKKANNAKKSADIFPISLDDYGIIEDYGDVELVYYKDGVLADDDGNVIKDEDVGNIMGLIDLDELLKDDDEVAIQNDKRRCYYHIERDLRDSFTAYEDGDLIDDIPMRWRDDE